MQLYRPDNPYRRPPAVRCRREVCDYLNKPKRKRELEQAAAR